MHPDLERYLRQQIELGGSEVYLDPGEFPVPSSQFPAGQGAGGPAAPGHTGLAKPESSTEDSAVSSVRSPKPTGNSELGTGNSIPKWLKDLPPIPGPGLSVMPPETDLLGDAVSRAESLDEIAGLIRPCRKCALCEGRTNTVPGEGHPNARLMCVGEGPGAREDATGRPFVGPAGQLLDQILASIGYPRETVYIANIVKCRPPQNRKPLPDEAASCLPYLHRQIGLVRPKVLLALGGTAAEWLLGVRRSLGDLRGQVHHYGSIPLIVTYHPAALLRNPNWKKPTWDDVRIARQLLDI